MKYQFEVNQTELGALLDALTKGAARHDSYAKYYPGRKSEQHQGMATVMKHLKQRLTNAKA